MIIVVDTNVLLVSISGKSKYHWLYRAILDRKINIAFTNEILMEYEEEIAIHWHPEVAVNVIRSLIELSSAQLTAVYFKFNIINDEDDNKFVDCAFASNADYIITNDKDFNALKNINFPSIKSITIEEFKAVLIEDGIIKE